jgi:acyl carrier protein
VTLPADLTSRLRDLSARQLDVAPSELVPDALLGDDLGVDSLAAIEWAMTIEDEFGVSMPDDAWESTREYGQVEQLVARLVGAAR